MSGHQKFSVLNKWVVGHDSIGTVKPDPLRVKFVPAARPLYWRKHKRTGRQSIKPTPGL